MRVTIAQLHVRRDFAANKANILSVLRDARPGDWVVFPEGALSGYFPEDDGFVRDLDPAAIDEGIREIEDAAGRSRCHCLFGTALRQDEVWRNAVVIHDANGTKAVYHKVGLSRLDKHHFVPGSEVPTFVVGGVTIGVQVCRELMLPAPWLALKQGGAQVVFHINNAIKPHDRIWEHLLVARALENGVFVCSTNNCAPPQELTSYLIDPSGRPLVTARKQTEEVITHDIDLGAVIPVLEQRQDF
jgi:predicted amidohydrolase